MKRKRIKAEKAYRRIDTRTSSDDRWPVSDLIDMQSTIGTIENGNEHLVPYYSLSFIPSASLKSEDKTVKAPLNIMTTEEDPPPSYDEYLKDPRYRLDLGYY